MMIHFDTLILLEIDEVPAGLRKFQNRLHPMGNENKGD